MKYVQIGREKKQLAVAFTRRRKVAVLAAMVLATSVPAIAGAVTGDGKQLQVFGTAQDFGWPTTTSQPLTGMTATATGNGYWMTADDGGVFSYGDARFYGSLGAVRLNDPIVDIARTPSGNGYWLVARDGGVFSFGDADFRGSTGSIPLNQPIASLFPTPTGNGYWLVALDGGVFSFGDARFYGSAANLPNAGSFVGGFASPSGNGYTLVASDGGVFTFGDARYRGNALRSSGQPPIVAVAPYNGGEGYWLLGKDGSIYALNAPYAGGANPLGSRPAVALAAQPTSRGYRVLAGQEQQQESARGTYLGTFSSTCYALGGHTASGLPVSEAIVATDPRVIPLGSRIYIEGVGYRIAADTGGAIKGNVIDIWKPTVSQCYAWGRRNIRVWKL